MTGKPAVFLDRDGVLNEDRGYVHRWEDFVFLPGVIGALRTFRNLGYLLVVVTNQSGVARGYFDEDAVVALHRKMAGALREHGIELAGIYYCPHHPEGIVPRHAIACSCRKPQPGLILRAAAEHDIDLARSLLVGDRESDIGAGRAAGIGRLYLVAQGNSPGPSGDVIRLDGLAEVARHVAEH